MDRLKEEDGWAAGPHVKVGEWNSVSVAEGHVSHGRLVASEAMHLTSLEASAKEHRLSIRVRLAKTEGEEPEANSPDGPTLRGLNLLSLVFTLTAVDGRQMGGMEVTIGRKTRDLSVEMELPTALSGPHRLKACLCSGDHVLDNARIDLSL